MDEVIFLPPGAGRSYDAGPMHAVFKADGAETGDRYCVSVSCLIDRPAHR